MHGYSILKLIHIIAVIIFLGNIFTGLFWMKMAVKSKDARIISHTMKGIIISDRWFTIPGVLIITAGGILTAVHANIPLLRTGWIFWSIVMFSVSGIIFSSKLAPLQKKIYGIAAGKSHNDNRFWEEFNKLYRAWESWGLAAIILPILAMMMMVLKIPATTFFFK